MPAGDKYTLTMTTDKGQTFVIHTFMPMDRMIDEIEQGNPECWAVFDGVDATDAEVIVKAIRKTIVGYMIGPYHHPIPQPQTHQASRRAH